MTTTPTTPTTPTRRRPRRACRRIGLAATATAFALLPLAPPAGAAPSTHLPLTQILREAVNRAHHEHPDAQFYGAQAVLPLPTTHPQDVRAWWIHFRAKDPAKSFEYRYATNGQYQGTQPWKTPIGIRAVSGFTLTESQAHDLAVRQGHTGAFKALYLSEPVVEQPHPTYYFCIPSENKTVAVDTVTHSVTTPLGCR
ncbi:hypothetical protein ACFV1W_37360 [Kitasatospora sp. NPDC059648]|uniref:hypothetical protein n=1 Tax=Kitasatospora sp. NPDC059648 TaxID=3346894 RepID=UPI0036770D8A